VQVPEPSLAKLAEGQVTSSEWRFRCKDGSEIDGEVVGRQLPHGRLLGMLRDITWRKKAEAALRESEERLRHLGDSLPGSAVYPYTRSAGDAPSFEYVSAGIEKLNGVRVEDVLRDAGAPRTYRRACPLPTGTFQRPDRHADRATRTAAF
jgi:PAS domain-containing protein